MAFHQIKPGYRLCKLSDDFQMHIKLMPLDFFISLCQRRHRYCFKRMHSDELFITREITRFGILKKTRKSQTNQSLEVCRQCISALDIKHFVNRKIDF